MKYMVLGEEGKEYGPVDAETLKKWVEHGRVFKDTRVRNALMKRWNTAADLDFLEESFNGQEELQQQEAGLVGKIFKSLVPAPKKSEESEKGQEKREVSTAFKNKYIPNPANIFRRVNAFVVDLVILALFAIVLFCVMNFMAGTFALGNFSFDSKSDIAAGLGAGGDVDANIDAETVNSPKKEKNTKQSTDKQSDEKVDAATPPTPDFKPTEEQISRLNHLFPIFFGVFIAVTLLYYGIALGLFAQTYGMHYWGIFIVKGHNDEAFPLRTFAFYLASLLLWPLMPLFVLFNPSKRTLHGYLTGCRLISITAKPK